MASSSQSDDQKKFVTLRSRDEKEFTVEESVAVMSQTIKFMVEDGCSFATIPLDNVDGKTLEIVIEYWKKHADENVSKEDLESFDKRFMERLSESELLVVVLAANYLNCKELLDMTCQKIADLMSGKSVEEIRAWFGVPNDFTPEEEEKLRRENAWAFDD